jgi:tetratricopeptide (TPR) repeat protein
VKASSAGTARRTSARAWLGRGLIGLVLVLPIAAGTIFMLPANVSDAIASRVSGQSATPSATADPIDSANTDTRVAVVENDVADIKNQQGVLLTTTIDQLRYLLGGLSVLLTVIVAIQAFLQARQDRVQHSGLEQVTQVMGVIEKTLQSNLLTSEEVRKQATELRAEMDTTFGTIIGASREAIERSARELADRPRHEHRGIMAELASFAREFDNFEIQYGGMSRWADRLTLSPRAQYVRGLAGHYGNDPAAVKKYLLSVVEAGAVSGETDVALNKRRAIAYYYLGLTSSNFGDRNKAAEYLQQAARIDTGRPDFLTMVAAAEAMLLAGDPHAVEAAQTIVTTIDTTYGPLPVMASEFRRHRSRALLVQANAAILAARPNDPSYRGAVRQIVGEALEHDRDYYYASITMAQVTDDPETARTLYTDAVEDIRDSEDLGRTTEARSQILLRMAYALALKHGPDDRHAGDQLDRALQLRSSLPQEGANVCTVFSILSKRNVSATTITEHIEAIRAGKTILPGPS